MAVHVLLEFRMGFSRGVGLLQVEEQRHQRLSDEATAIDAEVPALVGSSAERVGLRFGHAFTVSAARAARMKARILSGSFLPSARSTPEETSTPGARVMRMASAPLPPSSPPA